MSEKVTKPYVLPHFHLPTVWRENKKVMRMCVCKKIHESSIFLVHLSSRVDLLLHPFLFTISGIKLWILSILTFLWLNGTLTLSRTAGCLPQAFVLFDQRAIQEHKATSSSSSLSYSLSSCGRCRCIMGERRERSWFGTEARSLGRAGSRTLSVGQAC